MNGWRIGSLFSGIGGLELGLERAGLGQTTVQVEYDEFARSILEYHWPKADRYQDVRSVGVKDLGRVEVLCGGFPCQDISNANQNAQGLDGERSGLWVEFARIIGEVRPRIVVVENVAALLRRGMDRVLGDLAALGYDAEWGCVSAASVGAHHLRERIFIVAYPNGFGHLDRGPGIFSTENQQQTFAFLGGGGAAVAEAHGSGREEQWGAEPISSAHGSVERSGQDLADSNSKGGHGSRPRPQQIGSRQLEDGSSRPGRWATEPRVGRVANGIPDRVDRLRCLGNAVVPQVAEYVGGLIVTACTNNGPEAD